EVNSRPAERLDLAAPEDGRTPLGEHSWAFTSKDHNFFPGETLEKQIIVINNSREPVTAESQWSLGLPQALTGNRTFEVATGQIKKVPLSFELSTNLAPGNYTVQAAVHFSTGETQDDSFEINVLPAPESLVAHASIALFDPKGETAALLKSLGIHSDAVDPD